VTWGGLEGVLAGLLFSPTPCDVILSSLLEFHHHPQMQIASLVNETLTNFIKTKHPTKGARRIASFVNETLANFIKTKHPT